MRTTFVSQRVRWCSPDFPLSPCGDSDGPAPKQRADDGDRTRDLHLGKVPRYQLRYIRMRLTITRLPSNDGALACPVYVGLWVSLRLGGVLEARAPRRLPRHTVHPWRCGRNLSRARRRGSLRGLRQGHRHPVVPQAVHETPSGISVRCGRYCCRYGDSRRGSHYVCNLHTEIVTRDGSYRAQTCAPC